MTIKENHKSVIKSRFIQVCLQPSAALVGVEHLPAGQRTLVGDVLDPAAIWDQTLFSHHVVKVAGVELCEAVLLRDVNLHDKELK